MLPLHYVNVITLFYIMLPYLCMYVGIHAWCMYVFMYLHIIY